MKRRPLSHDFQSNEIQNMMQQSLGESQSDNE
jgi:hypothetical protein